MTSWDMKFANTAGKKCTTSLRGLFIFFLNCWNLYTRMKSKNIGLAKFAGFHIDADSVLASIHTPSNARYVVGVGRWVSRHFVHVNCLSISRKCLDTLVLAYFVLAAIPWKANNSRIVVITDQDNDCERKHNFPFIEI